MDFVLFIIGLLLIVLSLVYILVAIAKDNLSKLLFSTLFGLGFILAFIGLSLPDMVGP